VTSTPPLGGLKIIAPFERDGRAINTYVHQVDPQYLATMRIPLRRGRDLANGDTRAIVVSESLARRYWPDRDPIGEPLTIGADELVVVGIAGNARSLDIKDPEAVELYRLAAEADATSLALVLRTSGPTDMLAPSVQAVANAIDPAFRPRVRLLKEEYEAVVRDTALAAVALSALGLIALAVACLGVVGLVAYAVAARTREIGIRLALGAQSGDILASLVRQFRAVLIGGLAVGVLGAAGLAQLLRHELYGLSPIDPLAYIAAIVIFLLAVGLSALWPARRALRVDPLVALRCD
jgi:ABC-type antimicrobial peptide transport system permease subunit